eukprot:6193240-Pleurochrysis_carterae.AAC.1
MHCNARASAHVHAPAHMRADATATWCTRLRGTYQSTRHEARLLRSLHMRVRVHVLRARIAMLAALLLYAHGRASGCSLRNSPLPSSLSRAAPRRRSLKLSCGERGRRAGGGEAPSSVVPPSAPLRISTLSPHTPAWAVLRGYLATHIHRVRGRERNIERRKVKYTHTRDP